MNGSASKRIYTAMPTCFYGGSVMQLKIDGLAKRLGFSVVSPDTAECQRGYSSCGMDYFFNIIKTCDAVLFSGFLDGKISAGVAKEVQFALDIGMPVYSVETSALIDSVDLRRVLDVAETRKRLRLERVVFPGDEIVVWFSCGAASALAWKKTLELYGDFCSVVAVNNPVKEEDEDNRRFASDVSRWVGGKFVEWVNPKFPSASAFDVWEKKKAMSFPRGAPCTDELKKKARQDYELNHNVNWHVLGFTVDEKHRYDRFVLTERDNVLPVLIDAGLTKQGCMDIIVSAGIDPPRVYGEGYPNANCIGCVKATSPTYWNLVRRTRPGVFKERADQSRRLGVRLVRCHPMYLSWCKKIDGEWYDLRAGECLHVTDSSGKRKMRAPRIFLDELPEDAVGRPIETMNIDCGIFCEEFTA